MARRPGSFEELENLFASLASPGIRPGLDRISRLLRLVGNPQNDFPAVHIVGTNGKGSTAAFSESILRESGYRTALYTSPHLESPQERLTFRGEPVSLEKWVEAVETIGDAMNTDPVLKNDPPTFFELVTAAAFLLCSGSGTEIAVVEAGLGGRLDATNLLGRVVLTLAASISMDHMDFLGDTLEKIALEKFAVARKNIPFIFSGYPPSLNGLFRQIASDAGSLPMIVHENTSITDINATSKGTNFTFFSHGKLLSVHSALHGLYQVDNCALALSGMLAISGFFPRITDASIRKGIANAVWPGRFEILRPDPPLVLDGGHNPDGIRRLVESLTAIYGEKRGTIVYACMKDKDYPECISLLRKAGARLVCTTVPGSERAAAPETLAKTAEAKGWIPSSVKVVPDPLDAVRFSESFDEGTVCCGSLYFIGFLRKVLINNRKEFSF